MSRSKIALYFTLLVFAALGISLHYTTFIAFTTHWLDSMNWGFLILPIAVYMVFMRRKSLAALPKNPQPAPGLAIAAVGLLAYVVSRIGGIDLVSDCAPIITLTGAIGALFGFRYVKFLGLPLGYLLLMTSLVDKISGIIATPLQLISATAASLFCNTFGWPLIRDGTFLQLPQVLLQVAPMCSGVNQLVSLIGFAVPVAFIRQDRFWARTIIILLTVPAAILVNSIRICSIVIYNYHTVHEQVHGPHDIFRSPVIFPIAFIIVGGAALLLERFAHSNDAQPLPGIVTGNRRSVVPVLWWLNGLMALATVALLAFVPRPVEPTLPLKTLPQTIQGWRSESALPPDSIYVKSRPDYVLCRNYTDSVGHTVNVYYAYFRRQTTAGQTLNVYREWTRNPSGVFTLNSNGTDIRFSTSCFRVEKKPWCAYFSYIINNTTITDRSQVKKQILLQSLLYRRSNGGFLSISTETAEGNGAMPEALNLFLKAAAGDLQIIIGTQD